MKHPSIEQFELCIHEILKQCKVNMDYVVKDLLPDWARQKDGTPRRPGLWPQDIRERHDAYDEVIEIIKEQLGEDYVSVLLQIEQVD